MNTEMLRSIKRLLTSSNIEVLTNTICRHNFSTSVRVYKFNVPPSGNDIARPCGIASMFRLPVQNDTQGLDACFVGVPIDWGASNRSGTRFGPRYIRVESALIRAGNVDTGAAPYESLQVADVGDVLVTPFDLVKTCTQIEEQYKKLIENGCRPLTLGGDHTITYPILKAIKEKHGPVALVHIDAHMDVNEHMNGCAISHGTTFRRAYEDGCLYGDKVFQIGIRGSGYNVRDMDWPKSVGFNIIRARDIFNQSLAPLMESIREKIGDVPVYISFDIDGLDPSIASGTGTPEIAGLNSMQALEIIRGCKGLNIIGCDLVEVSPPYDTTGITALTAANLLFEMLCVLPGVKYYDI